MPLNCLKQPDVRQGWNGCSERNVWLLWTQTLRLSFIWWDQQIVFCLFTCLFLKHPKLLNTLMFTDSPNEPALYLLTVKRFSIFEWTVLATGKNLSIFNELTGIFTESEISCKLLFVTVYKIWNKTWLVHFWCHESLYRNSICLQILL